VRSHQGKAVKLHDDGHIEYESICDKSQIRTHDRTDALFHVSAKYAAWLAPGAVYSAIGTNIIAVWPSATAKTPSMVFGVAVK
jgi:predicted LPLAT superfamily acyltransferase